MGKEDARKVLSVRGLVTAVSGEGGPRAVLDGVGFDLHEGETLCIAGESGSGKSITALSLMGLLPEGAAVTAGEAWLGDRNLFALPEREMLKVRGGEIAMIFQEPMTSLNPVMTIGAQLVEALRAHRALSATAARQEAVDILGAVRISDPGRRFRQYPHELSGGMRQRVMIAMALCCNPKVLIADEPTTALDVTIQAQILDLLISLQKDHGMALVLITHDMGVVAETAERVTVMYAGQQVEEQQVDALFAAPRHPYTSALLDALPERSLGRDRLPTIEGVVPGAGDRPAGCLFSPRCKRVQDDCRLTVPPLERANGRAVRCYHPVPVPEAVS